MQDTYGGQKKNLQQQQQALGLGPPAQVDVPRLHRGVHPVEVHAALVGECPVRIAIVCDPWRGPAPVQGCCYLQCTVTYSNLK